MKVVLRIEGQEKEFVQSFVAGRMFRKTLEIQKKLTERLTPELLDEFVQYSVDLFGNQFTLEEFYDGVDARVIVETILGFVNEIINGASEAVGADSSDPN